jgi:hypothetical protein
VAEDYDKFLLAVANDTTRLVNNDDINITLSSKLFEMDNSVKKSLSDKENPYKMYFDYYNKNLD